MRSFILAVSTTLALMAPALAQQPVLPTGEGREIIAVACTQCHSAGAFMQLRSGPDAWRAQVHDMILRGAQVGTKEIDQVVSYLTANFGPGINVPAQIVPGSLPDGAGRDLVEQNCGLCHGLDRVTGARRSKAGLDALLARMTALGTPAKGEELERIRGYLHAQLSAN